MFRGRPNLLCLQASVTNLTSLINLTTESRKVSKLGAQ